MENEEKTRVIENNTDRKSNERGKMTCNSYPNETLSDALTFVEKIYRTNNVVQIYSRELIAEIIGKSVPTLNLTCSTWVQYNLVSVERGVGYKVTELFKSYWEKKHKKLDTSEELAKMFSNPEFYEKLIKKYNRNELPDPEIFSAIVTQPPYLIHQSSSSKAIKIFYENITQLDYLDKINNIFNLSARLFNSKTKGNNNIEVNEELYDSVPIFLEKLRKFAIISIPKEVDFKDTMLQISKMTLAYGNL